MSNPVTPSTKYGDLVGTVEIDGHGSPPLDDLGTLVQMPPHYCPIGIEFSLFESFDNVVPFALLAYDTKVVGCSPEEMHDYVRRHGELPVRRFMGRLRPSVAHRYIKRCSLVAIDSRTIELGDRLRIYDESAA